MKNFCLIQEKGVYRLLYKSEVIYTSNTNQGCQLNILTKGSQSFMCFLLAEGRWRGNHYPAQIVVFDWSGKEYFNSSSLFLPWVLTVRISNGNIHFITSEINPGDCFDIPSRRHYIICTLEGRILLDKPLEDNDELYWFCGETGYVYGIGYKKSFLLDEKGNVKLKTDKGFDECKYGIIKENIREINGNFYNRYYEKLEITEVKSHCLNYSIVKNGKKCGIVDENGKMTLPCIYDDIEACKDGSPYIRIMENNKWRISNIYGYIISPLEYESISAEGEGLYGYQESGKWGFRTYNNNEIIIPPKYEKVQGFSDGLAPVLLNGKWGYINKQDEVVIPFMYNSAEKYQGGVAIVSDDTEDTQFLPNNCVQDIVAEDELPYSSVIPSWIHLEKTIMNCGISTCKYNGDRYIYSTEPIFSKDNLSVYITGRARNTSIETKLILFYLSTTELTDGSSSISVQKDNSTLWSDEMTFGIYKLNMYKAEVSMPYALFSSLNQIETLLEISGQINLSLLLNISLPKILAIKYLLDTTSFTQDDCEILINGVYPNWRTIPQKQNIKCKINSDEKIDNEIKDCLNILSKLDFDNMEILFNFLSSPKGITAYKNLASITKDFDPPHPLVKLLSKIPNKAKLLNDIKTVNENRQFKANHRLISSVFKKNTELDPNTIKFINKIKQALK